MRDAYMGLLPLSDHGSINWLATLGLISCIVSGYVMVTVLEAVYDYGYYLYLVITLGG